MITTMRDRFKSKKYQIVIWIAIISLFGTATVVELFKKLFGSGDWIIKINKTEISPQQFARKVEEEKQYIEYFRKQFGAYANILLSSSGLNLDPKELAINALTTETLLNQQAKKLNIQFDRNAIQGEILKKIPKEVIAAYGTVDLNLLSQLFGYTNVLDFEKQIESSLKTTTALELISAALFIPDFEIKNNYLSSYAKRKFSILTFPLEKYVNEVKKTALKKDEVKNYFDEQNKKDKKYWIPEKREGIKWEFNMNGYGIAVTGKDLQDYYNKNKKEFLETPAKIQVRKIVFKAKDKANLHKIREKAQKIHAELVKDKSKFAEFAKKYSEDKETADKGGLTNFFEKGKEDQALEKAAFELKIPGDISNLIETKNGIEIIQLESKKPVVFKKFEDVREKIKSKVEKEKFEKQFNADMKRLNVGSNIKKTFEEFAKKKNAKSSDIELMDNDRSMLAQKLFTIKNENGIDSYVEDNKGIAVQLTQIDKSHAPTFESVQKKVEDDLYKQKALEKLKIDVQKAKLESSSKSFDKLRDEFGASLKSTTWLDSNDKDEIEKLKKENIPTYKLFDLDKEDAVTDSITEKYGYLIKLDHIESFNQEDFEDRKNLIKDELLRKRRQDLEAGFIASLKKNAKININEKALKQFRSAR